MITPSFGLTATERVLPKLALDFTTASLDPRVTFTRTGNTATVVNSSGDVAGINADLPRFDFNPTTLACKGLLIEEARTNSIRNNTMQGAVAGSPGTSPTNWIVTSTGGVFTRTIVGTGTENGINYIDVRYQTSGSGTAEIYFDALNAVAAASGQSWTGAHYVKIAAGSTTNLDYMYVVCLGRNVANTTTTEVGTTIFTPTTAGLITQRYVRTLALANVLTAFVATGVGIAFTGAADITVRIGLPQLELGAFTTSVIPTGSGAVTRNADIARMTGTNFSSWYNASEGAFVAVANKLSAGASTARIFSANAGSSANRLSATSSVADLFCQYSVGGVNTNLFMAGTLNNTSFNLAYGYKANLMASALKGATPVTNNTATIPTVDRMEIGSETGALFFNGHIQAIRYYPQRIINAEIQAFSKG